MSFVNLGTRNKGIFWEYIAAYSYLHTKISGTAFRLPSVLSIGEGIANQHCHEPKVMDAFSKRLFWKEFRKGQYSPLFFKRIENDYTSELHHFEKAVSNIKLSAASNATIAKLSSHAVEAAAAPYKPMMMALLTMNAEDGFTKELKKVLSPKERRSLQILNETKATLLTTARASMVDREEQMLYEIEKQYRTKFKTSSKKNALKFFALSTTKTLMRKLTRDFGWFHMEYMQNPFTEKDYREELLKRFSNETQAAHSPIAAKHNIQQRQQLFFKVHKKARTLQELTRVLQSFAYILDDSKVVAIRDNFLMRPILAEAAKRIGTTWDGILYLTLPEIQKYLLGKTKVSRKFIASRKKFRVLLFQHGVITAYEGTKARKIANKLLLKEKRETGNVVKGIIAYPGIVRGKVVRIESIHDRGKFKKGDILVTHDGSAELTLFLKLAGAIVTNQGGMICHAAIVAREIKTPCIVGTKNATNTFKDGDLIEVNANEGFARKVR